MGYIGPRNSDQFKSMATQTITGNGSATSFSLNQAVANSSEVRFVVNNVVQKPDVDYTATGTTLGTGSNVLAGSDAAYVVFVGAAVGSQTPSTGSVDHTSISSAFNGMYLNLATVTSTVTITSAQNAFLAGPVNFTNTVTVEGTLTVI
ncbi:MAG: hypothetical protein CMI74_09580 [Candidatus Pelagibacter sp.]|nr:hypothetical protein [Candidatus Pelagibacter sp.]